MTLTILKPGILTTVQDLGRARSRSLGINPNGAMDTRAVRILNTLLGNDEPAAVLEMHYPAAEIRIDVDCSIAVGGADFSATLASRRLNNWSSRVARAGDLLRFDQRLSGARSYLAVKGGIGVNEWLGSRSTNLVANVGGWHGRALQTGDVLPLTDPSITDDRVAGRSLWNVAGDGILRMIVGPEFPELTALADQRLRTSTFKITPRSDRMGYRLEGETLSMIAEHAMVSAGVAFGTVQLLPDSQMIVLMADHQTTGGYPRIGCVVAADHAKLAQMSPGEGVRFKVVSVAEAESLELAFERDLACLRVGLRFAASPVIRFSPIR